MNLILFDDDKRVNFYPFTHTRPVADIRCGILTMRERWEHFLNIKSSSTLTHFSMQDAFPLTPKNDNIFVNARLVASKALTKSVKKLMTNELLQTNSGEIIAFRSHGHDHINEIKKEFVKHIFVDDLVSLEHVWDIFRLNNQLIQIDFETLTKDRSSANLPNNVIAINKKNIFVERDAQFGACTINATDGPVYIGSNAVIMDGTLLRGSLGIQQNATIKMGAKIYGGTTIGQHCKVGGEVNNVVFFDFSNKGHDGFIGNAVIGSWCNLGADTNCSNLKNNYAQIKIYDEHLGKMIATGLQFCGLLMGDHSKCGINTMFNTGTVVGVSCNLFGAGFPEKFLPSFTWGGISEKNTYRFDKALETAERMMDRRGKKLSKAERETLKYIFNHTKTQRQ